MVLRKGIRKIKQGMKMYNNQLTVLRTELRTCKRKGAEQSKQLAEQQNLLAEQQKQTLEYANRLDENDKKNEEMARKFSTLLQVCWATFSTIRWIKTLGSFRSSTSAKRSCSFGAPKVQPFLLCAARAIKRRHLWCLQRIFRCWSTKVSIRSTLSSLARMLMGIPRVMLAWASLRSLPPRTSPQQPSFWL